MQGSPGQGSSKLTRDGPVKRQDLIGAVPESDEEADNEVIGEGLPPVVETVARVITVINGYTLDPGLPAPTPGPPAQLPPEADETSTSSRVRPQRPIDPDAEREEDEETSRTTPTRTPIELDSPSTQRIISGISPTLSDEDEEPTSRSRIKSVSSSKTKTNTPTGLSDKAKGDKEEKGGPSATVWIGVACGVVGALLLVMAISAYYRRWRRRRRAMSDDESFVTKEPDPMFSPRSLARSSMASEKFNKGPDWSDAPLVPPVPAAFYQRAGQEHLLPEPGSDRVLEDTAPWQRESYSGDTSPVPPAVPRYNERTEPISIETAGNTRFFTRPASEVILNGQAEQFADQTYDYGYQYQPPDVRHNSYASSRYEAIEDTSAQPRKYQYI